MEGVGITLKEEERCERTILEGVDNMEGGRKVRKDNIGSWKDNIEGGGQG